MAAILTLFRSFLDLIVISSMILHVAPQWGPFNMPCMMMVSLESLKHWWRPFGNFPPLTTAKKKITNNKFPAPLKKNTFWGSKNIPANKLCFLFSRYSYDTH
jgi:hypothetical protein